MVLCKGCGTDNVDYQHRCTSCGAQLRDLYSSPQSVAAAVERATDAAPFGYTSGGVPRRISTISKLALAAACIVPPVGFILGIIATLRARRIAKRPGNKAMAISSIFASLHIGLIWGAVGAGIIMAERDREQLLEQQQADMERAAEVQRALEALEGNLPRPADSAGNQ